MQPHSKQELVSAPRSESLAPHAPAVQHYAEQSKAASTKRAYTADWRHFTAWCKFNTVLHLPAEPATVAAYISDLAEQRYKVATITRRLASISQAHQLAGFTSPTQSEMVRTVMKGIRRALGTAQQGKAAATVEVVRLLLEHIDGARLTSCRDRALLLLGFAGAFRRSELVDLDVADLKFERAGLRITLRHSKTNQEGALEQKGIPYGLQPATCPVRALEQWLALADIKSGAVFRPIDRHGNLKVQRLTAQSVALIVKRYASAAGLAVDDFSGHSLRAGLATSAAAAGVSERKIMQQTGHKSTQMVRRYIRDADLFKENAAGQVGL